MNETLIVRAQVVRAFHSAEATTVVGQDGTALRFGSTSAPLVREIFDFFLVPRTRADLLARLAQRAGLGGPDEVPIGPVDEILTLLMKAGALASAKQPARQPVPPGARIVVGITGALAALEAPGLLQALLGRGHSLRVAMTRAARRFVRHEALQVLLHHKVYRGLWDQDSECPVPHVNLAEWAEAVLIYPTTATTLSRMARGDCSDLVSAVAVTTSAPVVLAPSMSSLMAASPAVRRNLEQLRDDGFTLLEPVCGMRGAHRPESRTLQTGSPPPPRVVADLLEHILSERRSPSLPLDVEGWERTYAETSPERLPWWTETPDTDLTMTLQPLAGGTDCRFLDLGTGHGTEAIAAARLGFEVVATDVSPSALALARRRAGGLPISWVLDDAAESRLWGQFDIVHDHGCLHCLPRPLWQGWARTVTRLAAPGSLLLVKAHTPEAAALFGTQPVSVEDLGNLLGAAFAVVSSRESVFAGPAAAAATFMVLRRVE